MVAGRYVGGVPNELSFGTFAEAQATELPSWVEHVFLTGYEAPGDGGAAQYKVVASEPAHTGKLQTANGVWCELNERQVLGKMIGVPSDGVTDARAKIIELIELGVALNREVILVGSHVISQQIVFSAANPITDLRLSGYDDATVTMVANSTGSTGLIKFFDAERVTIENIEWNGNRKNQVIIHRFGIESGGGLVFVGGRDITIRRCRFISTTDTGLRCRNVSNVLVEWNEFRDNGDRQIYIGPGGSDAVDVENIVVRNNTCDWDGSDPWTARGTARGGAANQIQFQAPFSFNADAAVNEDLSTIFITSHQLWTDDRVIYRDGGGTSIGGLTDGNVYWVTKNSDNRIQLRATYAGDIIPITKGVGTTHTIEHACEPGDAICLLSTTSIDFDASNISGNVINIPSHGLTTYDRYWYDANNNIPVVGLTSWVFDYSLTVADFPVYFVEVVDNDNIRLLSSVDGPIVEITAGSGTHKLRDYAFSSRITASYNASTQTATITEGSFGSQQLTIPTNDSKYLIRQGISDRIQLFLFGIDTLTTDFPTFKNARIENNTLRQETKFGSVNASCIATRPVENITITNNLMEGGGNTLSTAHYTRQLTIANNVIHPYSGAYAIELANDLNNATITGNVILGEYLVNTAISFNGGASNVNVDGNIIRGFRRGIVTASTIRFTNTAQGGTSDSITLAANTSDRDNDTYIVGSRLFIRGGTGEGQEVIPWAYDSTTDIAKVYPPFDVTPDATSQYAIVEMTSGASMTGNNISALEEAYLIQRSEDFSINGGETFTYTLPYGINMASSRDGIIANVNVDGPNITVGAIITDPTLYIPPGNISIVGLKVPDTVGADTLIQNNTNQGLVGRVSALACNQGVDIYDLENYTIQRFRNNAPEGNRPAGKGSIYMQTNGLAGDTGFYKAEGTGNTGWRHFNALLLRNTRAEMEDITNALNTTRKYQGKLHWDATLRRTLYSDGTTAGDVWYPVGGAYGNTFNVDASAGNGSSLIQNDAAAGCLYAVSIEVTEAFDGDSSTTFQVGIGPSGSEYLAATAVTGVGQKAVSSLIPGNGADDIYVSWTNNSSATTGAMTVILHRVSTPVVVPA